MYFLCLSLVIFMSWPKYLYSVTPSMVKFPIFLVSHITEFVIKSVLLSFISTTTSVVVCEVSSSITSTLRKSQAMRTISSANRRLLSVFSVDVHPFLVPMEFFAGILQNCCKGLSDILFRRLTPPSNGNFPFSSDLFGCAT